METGTLARHRLFSQTYATPRLSLEFDENDELSTNSLPSDIATLFKLADQLPSSFALPSWMESLVRAHGYSGVNFPCQVGSRFFSKTATAEELEKRLAEFNKIGPALSGHGKILEGVRYFMIACLIKNVGLTAFLLLKSAPHPNIETGLAIAGEVAAGLVHAKVYKEVDQVQQAHKSVKDMRGILSIYAPEGQPLDNLILANAVSKKLNTLEDDIYKELPNLITGFITLMVANYLLAQAAR